MVKAQALHRGFDPVPLTLDLWNPKSIPGRLRQTVEDFCDNFRVIPIRGFRFIVLIYTPTHPPAYTHRDKLIAISAPPYYVVDVDDKGRPVVADAVPGGNRDAA